MNIALWVGQGLLALLFTATGTAKVALPRERLVERMHMHWAATWPRARVKALGLAEIAGAIGLVIPLATGIAPVLTPIAALCLALLMVGAIRAHKQLGEGFVPAVVAMLLCLAVAAGRFHS
jgi:hypothetical protein